MSRNIWSNKPGKGKYLYPNQKVVCPKCGWRGQVKQLYGSLCRNCGSNCKVWPSEMVDVCDGAFAVLLKDGTIALHITKKISDKAIDDLIRQVLPKAMQTKQGCVCAFFGWDHDERELYEIPEAIALAQRLIQHGFISVLHGSTLMEKEEKPWLGRMFGAMEVWALGTGHLHANGDLDITEDHMKLFFAELDRSNKIVTDLISPKVSDGMHRTQIK